MGSAVAVAVAVAAVAAVAVAAVATVDMVSILVRPTLPRASNRLQFFLEFDDFGGVGMGSLGARKGGGGGTPCLGAYQFLVEIDDFWRARGSAP